MSGEIDWDGLVNDMFEKAEEGDTEPLNDAPADPTAGIYGPKSGEFVALFPYDEHGQKGMVIATITRSKLQAALAEDIGLKDSELYIIVLVPGGLTAPGGLRPSLVVMLNEDFVVHDGEWHNHFDSFYGDGEKHVGVFNTDEGVT